MIALTAVIFIILVVYLVPTALDWSLDRAVRVKLEQNVVGEGQSLHNMTNRNFAIRSLSELMDPLVTNAFLAPFRRQPS